MKSTLRRLVAILPRSDVPEKHIPLIRHQLPRLDEQLKKPSLIDHLTAQKAEREAAYNSELRKAASERREPSDDVLKWPPNLRFERRIKKEEWKQVLQSAITPLRQIFRER